MSQTKSIICELLEWDDLQYGECVYQCGCLYLQYYMPHDPEGIDALLQHKLFWNWWKSKWNERDYFLLNTLLENDYSVEEKRFLYNVTHDARILAYEISLSELIPGTGNKTMIIEIIKAEVL